MNSSSQSPRVSIGMPVFNGHRYLRRALDSLLCQTFDDMEVIISDNCSTDDTESISRHYGRQDARIRYIRQRRNLGAIGNFNFVFSQASGEYFKWASYDDVCHPTFVETCVRVLDEHPQVVWCHCEADQIDESGESWLNVVSPDESSLVEYIGDRPRWVGHPRSGHDSLDPSKRFAGVLLGTPWAVDSYGLIRSSALRRTRMLLPYYGSEKVLLGELALQGAYFHVPDCLFAQRIHPEASGNLQSAEFEAAFVVGDESPAFVPTRFALVLGHLGAVMRSNLSLWQRIKCLIVVSRYLLQLGKWKRVLGGAWRGRGVGGEGYQALQRSSANRNTSA